MLWVALVATMFFPFAFAVGLFVGKWHAERLAVNGGEDRYPNIVAKHVKAYRNEKQYYIDFVRQRKNND